MPSLPSPSLNSSATSSSAPSSDPSIRQEYSTFLHPSFEADAFAHAVLKGEDYSPPPPQPQPSSETDKDNEPTTTTTITTTTTSNKLVVGGVGGDVSTALSKLNFGIEDLNRQLKIEIFKNHELLLLQVSNLSSISKDLLELKITLQKIESNVEKLNNKIKSPFEKLNKELIFLVRLKKCQSLVKRGMRFINLVKKLEIQMNEIQQQQPPAEEQGVEETERRTTETRERSMAEAALILSELEILLNAGESPDNDNDDDQEEEEEEDAEAILPIRSLSIVSQLLPRVSNSREIILQEMENSIQKSLTREPLDPSLLASSLQTGYNLKLLPELVDSLVKSLNDLVTRKVKHCFDLNSLAREISSKEGTSSSSSVTSSFVYKSRTRLEPTSSNLSLWTSTMWNRLETLLDEMVSICIKVYTLEKVLNLKRDQTGQSSFLEEILKLLENKPSGLFWLGLSKNFQSYSKELVKTSNFLQNLFSTGYPKLLRLFQEFFSKISVHTDTVYTLNQQSPSTVLVLRSIQPFETLYLNRCQNRLTESINSCFSTNSSLTASFTGGGGGGKNPSVPNFQDGLNLARVIVNELDAARFDPILVLQISKISKQFLETFLVKIQGLILQDHGSTSLLGPLVTSSQLNNADLTSCLYHLWFPLEKTLIGFTTTTSNNTSTNNNKNNINKNSNDNNNISGETVESILKPSVDRLKTCYLGIVSPLIMSIRREFSSILARMHRMDYSSESSSSSSTTVGGTSSSNYLIDLSEKLNLIKSEILTPKHYKVDVNLLKDWGLDLSRFVVQTFLLHSSILGNLSESGKLKLVQDTTFLEFNINNFLSGFSSSSTSPTEGGGGGIGLKDMGDQFKALRAFRPLLFQETSTLLLNNPSTSSSETTTTTNVPTLILLHHLISRSPQNLQIPLPHKHFGWNEFEYVRWLNEHGEQDRLNLIKKVLKDWLLQKQQEREGEDSEEVTSTSKEEEEELKIWRDWVRKVIAE
ncbi:hypothetical protein JCM3765_003744 [Sporobolomyces pararoseus]